jgi:hypothetical protein
VPFQAARQVERLAGATTRTGMSAASLEAASTNAGPGVSNGSGTTRRSPGG